MPRKSKTVTPSGEQEIDLDILGGQKSTLLTKSEAENQNAVLAQMAGDVEIDQEQGRDLVNQILGQAQAFSAASSLLRTFGVSKLAYVKERKLYKGLAGTKTPNGSELRGTWEEFCGLLTISVDKANEDIANLRALGEEALERMTRMGIGYRELRQFRKLPPDQRAALVDVAKSGDKDDLLELAEELLEVERAANEELAADKAALEKRAHVLERELEKTSSEYWRFKEGLKRQVGKAVFADRTGMVREEAMAYQLEGQLAVDSLAKLFDEVIREPMQDDPEWRARFEIVWIQAKALYARARLLMEAMVQAGATDDIPLGAHMLTADEAAVWLADAELIYREHEAQKQRRELAREASKPRGPGRPKGSGKKGAE